MKGFSCPILPKQLVVLLKGKKDMLIFGGILGGLFSNKALLIFHHSSKNIKMMFIVYFEVLFTLTVWINTWFLCLYVYITFSKFRTG